MPVPTSNQGAESKRWLVPLLANLAVVGGDPLQHRLHFDCDVPITIAVRRDMADAGPREVISDDRNLAARRHVEYAQPGHDPLLRVSVAGELSAWVLHLQQRPVSEVAGIDDRATVRADHEACVTDRMARR